jgi:hypothetical protein
MTNKFKFLGIIAFAVLIGITFISCEDGGEQPYVYVTVSPASASVTRGGTQRFTAVVSGIRGIPQGVTWSILEDRTGWWPDTRISSDGVLTVAANESRTTLTVQAASVFNNRIIGTATVFVGW